VGYIVVVIMMNIPIWWAWVWRKSPYR